MAVAILMTAAACQDEGAVRVSSLSFQGNQAFSGGELAAVCVTRASGWLPWSKPRYFNRETFDQDLVRLTSFYGDRGFPHAHVNAVDVQFNSKRDAVSLRIHLAEGDPLLVERVVFTGFDESQDGIRRGLTTIALRAGVRRDRQVVAASRERLTFLLKDQGYPAARVESREEPGSAPDRVVMTFVAAPGSYADFGDISISGLASIDEDVVRRSLAIHPGDRYRESLVLESQHRLLNLGLFDFAHIGPPADHSPDGARLPMVVSVAEGKPQRIQFGIGYGSEEGPRGSFKWEHLNFFGSARQLATEGKFSYRLRGLAVDLTHPYWFGTRLTFGARLSGWLTNEPSYTSRTLGGKFTVTYHSERTRGPDRDPSSFTLHLGYTNESLSYTVDPQTLADLSQVESLIGLGLDPVTGSGNGRVASIDLDAEQVNVDRRLDAHRGYSLTMRARYAAPSLGGTYRFTELAAETRGYVPLGTRNVVAGRVHAGVIRSPTAADVPFSERFFLGGATTLRGWGHFQVAPLTPGGLPIGGRAVVDATAEWRTSFTPRWGAVLFVDAGNVFPVATIEAGHWQADVGPGLRWTTPVGVVRVDVGFQLTRIAGLKVSGQPELRHWRLHFSIGQAF